MSGGNCLTTYRCNEGVRWAVTTGGILLLHIPDGEKVFLKYPQAVVWDLVSRGYSYEQTKSMLRTITSLDEKQAAELLVSCLEGWVKEGFLITE
jgi:hypothetical protein